MSAPDFLFPDNTALINFAIIGELPLLGSLLGTKGAWAAAVAAECERSARSGEYPDALGDAASIITTTFMTTEAERVDARTIRNEIAKPNEPFPKSYGEAETLAIITKRGLSSIVITDDGGVGRRSGRHRGSPSWRWPYCSRRSSVSAFCSARCSPPPRSAIWEPSAGFSQFSSYSGRWSAERTKRWPRWSTSCCAR